MRMTSIAAVIAWGCASGSGGARAEPVTATVGASAEIISPAEASAAAATRLLFSQTPGVLTIAIPGAGSLALTATGADSASGTFTFAASAEGAAALRALMADLAAGASGGTLSPGVTVSGFLAGQGVQLVVLGASQGADGSGSLRATITFD